MRSLRRTLLAALCCLVVFQAARADVNTVTDISYYEPTNSMRITATTYFNYDTWCYYDVYHWGQVYKDDQPIGEMFLSYQYDGIDAYNELYFPYDPTAEYTVEAYPVLNARYRHPIGDTYEDYYNYVQWSYAPQIYHPYYYGFTAPGPNMEIDSSSILLGTIYSFFTGGALAGPPDHVKVVSDTGNSDHDPDCGFPIRRITLQVVDQMGRRAGRLVSMRERFYTIEDPFAEIGGVWSSCTNQWATPSGCQLYGNESFFDRITAGCPPPPFPTSCGLPTFVNKWIWCPRGRPEKVLTTNVYDVTNQYVFINGIPSYNPGHELR